MRLARFIAEAQAAAQLAHPSIIPIHELGVLPDRRFFFTMKEIKGETLRDVIRAYLKARTAGDVGQTWSEITALADEMRTPIPEIRVGVRTGDTTARDRALHVKRPPHVLITTPESLFILLTTERGRHALKSVRTLILDELHAVAPNKRGSHLSLTVERLCDLAEGPVTRIGLSASQKPIEEMARFLTGRSREGASLEPRHTGAPCATSHIGLRWTHLP